MIVAIALYFFSLLCQVAAALYSLYLVRSSPSQLKWAWLALAAGLFLMIGRRITALWDIQFLDSFNLMDAALSVPISLFLLIGVIGIRKIIQTEVARNDLLSTITQIDPLTGAYSRAEIQFRIIQEIARYQRNNQSFSVLEIDIDHFKKVNDTYGHDAGDIVLNALIQLLKSELRISDSIGRIGGEEFLVLLPKTDRQEAIQIAERMRLVIQNSSITINDTLSIQITISIGVAMINSSYLNEQNHQNIMQSLVQQVDQAMYQAKNNGRNCCCAS
jgi:diguanylate cyclase (GGDEF)-like protein